MITAAFHGAFKHSTQQEVYNAPKHKGNFAGGVT